MNSVFLSFLLIIAGLSLPVSGKTHGRVLNCFKLHTSIFEKSSLTSNLPPELRKFLSPLKDSDKDKWIASRGIKHFENLKSYSSQLSHEYSLYMEEALKQNRNWFDDMGTLTARSKSQSSILTKLLRKDLNAFKKRNDGIRNIQDARKAIGDGIGTRLIFKADKQGKISPETIQSMVDEISEEIKNGRLRVTEIMNYRAAGDGGLPYLSEGQVKQLVRADSEFRKNLRDLNLAGGHSRIPEPLIVVSGTDAVYPSGYTSFHMNIKYSNGVTGELQVRGPQMQDAGEIQHLFYDLKSGKVIAPELMKNPVIASAVEEYKKLTPDGKEIVMKYTEEQLIHARKTEAGIQSTKPKLPAALPSVFDFDVLGPHLIND